MPEKRKAWAKVRHALYTDERALELSGVALALRLTLTVWAVEDDEQRVGGAEAPGVGWLLTEDGVAYTIRRIARLTRFEESQIDAALAELVEARIVVRSDAGAWGLIGWSTSQEDPSAARVRAFRERQRPGSSGSNPSTEGAAAGGNEHETGAARYSNAPETAEERGEKKEERGEISERADERRAGAGACEDASPAQPKASRPAPVDVPGSDPTSSARSLLLELGQLFAPTGREGRVIESRRIRTSDPRALERAERLLRVPLDGLDEDAARRMRRERLEHVLDVCRRFADICRQDSEQAAFWGPTMLETDRARGRDRSAWDVVESIVAERQTARPRQGARASPSGPHVVVHADRQYSNGTPEF